MKNKFSGNFRVTRGLSLAPLYRSRLRALSPERFQAHLLPELPQLDLVITVTIP